MPLATYTGVLIGNTAVPLWNSARRTLPLLFGASSVASLAGLFNLMDLTERERRIMRRFGLIGQAAELLAGGCRGARYAQGAARLEAPARRILRNAVERGVNLYRGCDGAVVITGRQPLQARDHRLTRTRGWRVRPFSASFTPASAARAIRKPPSCTGRDGGAGPQARGPVPRPALATTRRAPAPRGPRPLPCYKSSRSFHPAR